MRRRGAMNGMFWPSALAAVAVVAVSVPQMWLVAVFVVKVLRWPSEETVRRWRRYAERHPHGDSPATPMFWAVVVLGLTLPLCAGVAIVGVFEAPTSRPDYTGHVLEAGPCEHGLLELWWLYRCEAVVEVDGEPVRSWPERPAPPGEPVTVDLLAREPVRAGATVGLEARFDDDQVVLQWGLISEADRPSLVAGAVVGWVVSVALSVLVGLWWRRSRPRLSGPLVPSTRAPVSEGPTWWEDEDGYRIELRATRISMSSLKLLIIGIILLSGLTGAATYVLFLADAGWTAGPPSLVSLISLLGIPFVGLLLAGLVLSARRRTSGTYRVGFSSRGVRITSDGESSEYVWPEIDRLVVRTDSDYARVEIRPRSRGVLTLMVGIAGRGRGLSEMPYALRRLIADRGFTERPRPPAAPGLHRFTSDNA
jgi:hypothetical protein